MSPLRPSDARLRTAAPEDRLDPVADALAPVGRRLAALVRTAAFWVAVVLPFLHLPLLFALGVTDATAPALVALWGLNAAALVVGAAHEPAPATRPAD